jgi:hypothetical protein
MIVSKRTLSILLFILAASGVALCEKRNLVTPLSRLVGHWKFEITGEDYYFSLNTPTGSSQSVRVIVASATKVEYHQFLVQTYEPAGTAISFEQSEPRIPYWTNDKFYVEKDGQLIKVDPPSFLEGMLKKLDGANKKELLDRIEKTRFRFVDLKTSPEDDR